VQERALRQGRQLLELGAQLAQHLLLPHLVASGVEQLWNDATMVKHLISRVRLRSMPAIGRSIRHHLQNKNNF